MTGNFWISLFDTPPPPSVLWDPKFQWEAKDFYLSSRVHSKNLFNSCMDDVVLILKVMQYFMY